MLTVAVTGLTGEIGKPFIAALERNEEVGRILGIGRRSFDPTECGWAKVEYRRGDVLDRAAVDALVTDADVVVHLAFVIVAGAGKSEEINLTGSRNVFEATAAAGARRLIYTSSVAAYGFGANLPPLLTEEVQASGSDRHPYSAQKAAVEALLGEILDGTRTESYVFRPCIVAGPQARLLVDSVALGEVDRKLPRSAVSILNRLPLPRPVLPDPGVRFQLVHHDDVAAALCSAVLGEGAPGVYNLAAEGEVTVSDLACELGWHAFPTPSSTVALAAEIIGRLPFLPDRASWVEALRRPVLMDASRARRQLEWNPRYDAAQTLRAMVAAHRGAAAIGRPPHSQPHD